jgi:WD40 repeat protein
LTYDAFISYSHAADGRLAPALQSGLQRLAKPWYRLRALRVFRDETGLSTNPHLWSSISVALDEAEWFVLLASPESAMSPWVDKEIAHWLATKPADRILPALTVGAWDWDSAAGRLIGDAVPERLAAAIAEEPRHLDLRWAHDEADLDLRNSGFRSAIADLAAPMHGVAKDELEGEDIRQHRRARRLARVGVATVVLLLIISVIFGGVAISQRNQAQAERTRAERSANEALARGLAAKADGFLREQRVDRALLLAVEAEHFAALAGPTGPAAQQARDTLLRAIAQSPATQHLLDGQDGNAAVISYSPQGSTIVSVSDSGVVRAWDAATDQALPHQLPPLREQVVGAQVSDTGLLAASSVNIEGGGHALTRLWDVKTGQLASWQPRQLPTPPPGPIPGAADAVASGAAFSRDGSLLALSKTRVFDSSAMTLVDVWSVAQHRRVAPRMTIPGASIGGVAISPDNKSIAIGVTVAGVVGLSLQLVDVATGKLHPLIHAHDGTFNEIASPFFATVAFSPDGRRVSSVASGATDSGVATFDTRTGTPVAHGHVGPGQTIMAASDDMRELVIKSPTGATIIDAASGARLADLPIPTNVNNLPPLAFDPTRSNVVLQDGAGVLTVADWTKLGAPDLVTTKTTRVRLGEFRLAPDGSIVDLAQPLHSLGLSSTAYTQRPWRATVSRNGQVAILSGSDIAIWDPAGRKFVRRLTGAPPGCATTDPLNLAFAGTATQGRVVLGCPPVVASWDLAASQSRPAWRRNWTHRFDNSGGFVISSDRATVADSGLRGAEILDGRTGRTRTAGPAVTTDNLYAIALSPDARLVAVQHWSGLVDLVDTKTGAISYTLSRVTPGTSVIAAVVFSKAGNLVASWNDAHGAEIWDATTGEAIAELDGRAAPPAADQQLAVSFANNDQSLRLVEVGTPTTGEGTTNDNSVRRVRTVTWSLRTADWIDAACGIVARDLTTKEWHNYISATVPYQHTCTPLLARTTTH